MPGRGSVQLPAEVARDVRRVLHTHERQVHPSVPVYAGRAASAIVEAAQFFSPGPSLRTAGHLVGGETFSLGPFRVTPLLVDHSAFDAYAVVLDAGGARLMYTGDLRGHGRKRTFERLLASPPADVDALQWSP